MNLNTCEMAIKPDYCMKVKGDCMANAGILDGAIVFIKQQDSVKDGEIGAVKLDGEPMIKHVYYYPGYVVLQPASPGYKSYLIRDDERNRLEFLGKVIGYQFMFK